MLETILSHIATISNPFSLATWFILGILSFAVWLFTTANNNPASRISWEDLTIDTSTGKASPYKIGYMIGVIVSSWVVITFAAANVLSFDILGMYLSFLLGGASMNAFIKRTNAPTNNPPPIPPQNDEDPKG